MEYETIIQHARTFLPGEEDIVSKHVRNEQLHGEDPLRELGRIVDPLHPARSHRDQARRLLVAPGNPYKMFMLHSGEVRTPVNR